MDTTVTLKTHGAGDRLMSAPSPGTKFFLRGSGAYDNEEWILEMLPEVPRRGSKYTIIDGPRSIGCDGYVGAWFKEAESAMAYSLVPLKCEIGCTPAKPCMSSRCPGKREEFVAGRMDVVNDGFQAGKAMRRSPFDSVYSPSLSGLGSVIH